MKLAELFEAERKTKTKTKSKIDLGNAFSDKKDEPLAKKEPPASDKSIRGTSKEKTEKATSGINLDDKALKHLANLHKNMADIGVEPEPPGTELIKPEDVEKVANNALKVAGVERPDWHMVANLPGNMSRAIQSLGKALFGSLTKTPTSKITMIGNVGGQGPNNSAEINAVANFLKKHADDLGSGNIDFSNIMPGYEAKIHNYVASGVHFMLVKDDFGQYIYSWPAHTSIQHKNVKELR